MDQIFDLFKRIVHLNVEICHSALMNVGGSVSLGHDDCCRIVFGGSFPLMDGSVVVLEEAFDKAFCIHHILQGFSAVGAAPLAQNCMLNKKVCLELSSNPEEDQTPIKSQLHQLDQQLQACERWEGCCLEPCQSSASTCCIPLEGQR